MASTLRIGTRGSALALVQARTVAAVLSSVGPTSVGMAPELAIIKTSGDRIADRPLYELGGKGLFTKEIDEALLEGRIDLAVHSAKDLPTQLPPGVVICTVLVRADARDALIAGVPSIAALPSGARLGTSSPRRAAQVLHVRPDLAVLPFRGNVDTRLRKIAEGEVDATLLAVAGLSRLDMLDRAAAILSPDEMLPAAGQGAIAITCREGDRATMEALIALDHRPSHQALLAERAFLAALDGSCRTPIAAHAVLEGDRLVFRGLVASLDGSRVEKIAADGMAALPEALGSEAGHRLLARLDTNFFAVKVS